MRGEIRNWSLVVAAGAFLITPPALAQIWTTGRLLPPPASPPPQADPVQAKPEPPPRPAPQLRSDQTGLPSIDDGARLDLLCFGKGAANKAEVMSAWGSSSYWGTFGNTYGSSSATIIGTRSEGFGDQVSLFIEDGQGRLRMPRVMLPWFHGGEDGWFKLKDIKIKKNEITATIGVNFINNPKLRLDRYTGMVSIAGKAGHYMGRCERFDPATMERAF